MEDFRFTCGTGCSRADPRQLWWHLERKMMRAVFHVGHKNSEPWNSGSRKACGGGWCPDGADGWLAAEECSCCDTEVATLLLCRM